LSEADFHPLQWYANALLVISKSLVRLGLFKLFLGLTKHAWMLYAIHILCCNGVSRTRQSIDVCSAAGSGRCFRQVVVGVVCVRSRGR